MTPTTLKNTNMPCHLSLTQQPPTQTLPLLTPPSMLDHNFSSKSKKSLEWERTKIFWWQTNISNRPFDQRSPVHWKVCFLWWHRHTHTHTHRQQADIVDSKLDWPKGRFSEYMSQMLNMCEWASTLPQNSIFLKYPLPGKILCDHGFNWYECQFWTAWDFSDLVQQTDLKQK